LRPGAPQSGTHGVHKNSAARPRGRREAEMLMTGPDPQELQRAAIAMCANAFGTDPKAGVLTYVSRGTDEDAHGVLAGFGLTGDIDRQAGDAGYDIIYVTLRRADMERIPESRVFTALEASTNCEVHIRIV